MRTAYVQIRVPVEVAERIDEIRRPTISRNQWCVNTLQMALDKEEAFYPPYHYE